MVVSLKYFATSKEKLFPWTNKVAFKWVKMWISHCYKFPLSPSKQSIYNHLWIIPSWWPGKTVPFQLPPRLGDTITLSISQPMVKIKLKLNCSIVFHGWVTRAEGVYITKNNGLFTYYCPLKPSKHILCASSCWLHEVDNSTLKACLGAWPKTQHWYNTS